MKSFKISLENVPEGRSSPSSKPESSITERSKMSLPMATPALGDPSPTLKTPKGKF
jgi:hypothetical protein